MSSILKLNNKYFTKGFFYWFGIEDNPFSKEVKQTTHTQSNQMIKKDLNKIRQHYRKSYAQLKQEIYSIE